MERRDFVKVLTFVIVAPASLFSQPPDKRSILLQATVTPPLAAQVANFTLVKPNGSSVKQTSNTDANGVASTTFRLKPSDRPGVYDGYVTVNYQSDLISDSASVTR